MRARPRARARRGAASERPARAMRESRRSRARPTRTHAGPWGLPAPRGLGLHFWRSAVDRARVSRDPLRRVSVGMWAHEARMRCPPDSARASRRRCAGPPSAARHSRLAGLLTGCGMGAEDGGTASKTGVVTGSPPAHGAHDHHGLAALRPARRRAYPTTALAAANASGAVGWSLAAGTLPAGMTLSVSGVLSGTPVDAPASTRSPCAPAAARRAPPARWGSRWACSAWSPAAALLEGKAWTGVPGHAHVRGRDRLGALRGRRAPAARAPTARRTPRSARPSGCPATSAARAARHAARGGHGQRRAGARSRSPSSRTRPPATRPSSAGPTCGTSTPSSRSASHAFATDLHAVARHRGPAPGREHLGRRRACDRMAETCVRVAHPPAPERLLPAQRRRLAGHGPPDLLLPSARPWATSARCPAPGSPAAATASA